MLKVILPATHPIPPFNELARDLRIQNRPLWLHQRNVLAPYATREMELKPGQRFPQEHVEMIVYRDNLFFDEEYIEKFISEARKLKRPVRAAFSADDRAFKDHALPLSVSYTPAGELYLADLWYYPNGADTDVQPLELLLRTKDDEKKIKSPGVGYSRIPQYMAPESGGDLIYQVPDLRVLIAIDCWVHVLIADIIFGQLARAERYLQRSNNDLTFKLKLLWRSLY